jgi:hypothetical protein
MLSAGTVTYLEQNCFPYSYCHNLMVWLSTGCDLDLGFIDHLHHSELQVITALSLTSALYKSSQHLLNIFQPAVPSSAVPWQRLLTVEIIPLHALKSYFHSLPCGTELSTNNWLTPRLAAISHQLPSLLFTGWLSSDNCQAGGHFTPIS